MTVNPFIDFAQSAETTRAQNLNALQQSVDAFQRDYSVLAPLTIVKFGILAVTLTGAQLTDPGQQFQVAHGLGYVPVFRMYGGGGGAPIFPIPDNMYTAPAPQPDPLPLSTQLLSWADTTNIYAVWHGSAQTPNQNFYYVIFSNPIPVNG